MKENKTQFMNTDIQLERYQNIIYDIANKYDFEPLFVDCMVSIIGHGYEIIEENFLKEYFIRLAKNIMKEVETGLKSKRDELKENSKYLNREIEKSDMRKIDPSDAHLFMALTLSGEVGIIKNGHIEAITYTKEDLEKVKQTLDIFDLEQISETVFYRDLKPAITQYKVVYLQELKESGLKINSKTGQPVKIKGKRKFNK